VGHKIGFTNRTIYAEYGVYAPMFGYMYDRTVQYAGDGLPSESGTRLAPGNNSPPLPSGEGWGEGARPSAVLSLSGLCQPRIEPEIAFMLRERPPPTRDARELLRCVEWLAHGFEIVQCHFPDWKFQAADTVADGGLHGRYVVGPRRTVEPREIDTLAEQLANFRISFYKNGALAAEGGGELVLGSPVNALAHLIEVLDSLPDHASLEHGELVTTGTLTAALPVAPGETWSTRIEGMGVGGWGLEVRFE
jgi:2-oxo-3-hexenedioate decarboxylase